MTIEELKKFRNEVLSTAVEPPRCENVETLSGMIDRETVVEGIEAIREFFGFGLPSQSPVFEAYRCILTDALALLKDQGPVEPIAIKQEMFDEFYGAVSCCPKCDCMWVMYRENDMHFCPECGQAVKWE